MKRIPICDGFKVTENGEVFDKRGRKRQTYKNGSGYIIVAVLVGGTWTTMGVHRLVAYTYVPNDKPFERNQVNHIDGNIENNHFSNLDWVTFGENNIHHAILNSVSSMIKVVCDENGELTGYKSLIDASEKTGLSVKEIWFSIKDSTPINGKSFSHMCRGVVKPHAWLSRHRRGTFNGDPKIRTGVKTLNVRTGEVVQYDSIYDCAVRHNLQPAQVYYYIQKNGRVSIMKKLYQVAYVSDEFVQLNKDSLEEILSRGSKPVIVFDIENNVFIRYASAGKFIRQWKLSKKAVTARLKADSLSRVDRFVFLYENESNFKRLADYVKVPALHDTTAQQ